MTKRKKHDPRKRLRNMLKGAFIVFDGNDQNQLDYRLANGLPMDRKMLDVATSWAWRFKVTLSLICKLNGAQRIPSEELIINQPCRINELTEFVKKHHAIMSLEQPAAWEVSAQTWKVEILG